VLENPKTTSKQKTTFFICNSILDCFFAAG